MDRGLKARYISLVQTRYIGLSALDSLSDLAPGARAPGWDIPPLWGWVGIPSNFLRRSSYYDLKYMEHPGAHRYKECNSHLVFVLVFVLLWPACLYSQASSTADSFRVVQSYPHDRRA